MLRPLLIYAFVLMAALMFLPTADASSTRSVSDARFIQHISLASHNDPAPSSPLVLEIGSGRFVAGAQSACVDLIEAKATKSPAKTSVEPQGFIFDGLTLNWNSTDILNVDSIRAVITDASGNRAVLELPPNEVLALLAHEQASVQGPAKIVTNDPARAADPKFVPCGLVYGGINWINPAQELKVVFSVIGSVETANGDLAPLEVSIETAVQP